MDDIIIQIADALVAALNAAPFSLPFEAVRRYRPEYTLAELAELRVTVVPKGYAAEMADRSRDEEDIQIDVAVQKKLGSSDGRIDQAAADSLMRLVGEIRRATRRLRLATTPPAIRVKTENVPIYSPEHMETKGVFTSVLTITFRVVQ